MIQWVLILFGLWLAYLSLTGLLEKRKAQRQAGEAASWPQVTGRVVNVKIEEGRSRSSETGQMIHTYRPEITYSYAVGGADRQGSRIAFGNILYYQPGEAEAFLQAHPEGGAIPVFHDPKAPDQAVLDRDPAHAKKLVFADFGMLLFGLVLIGLGLGGMLSKPEADTGG